MIESTALLEKLQSRLPLLWLNPAIGSALPASAPSLEKITAAEARLMRCEPLMACLFPELAYSAGKVESNLESAAYLQHVLGHTEPDDGKWFIKRDDALPVAGSIKARGGFHEVLALAESLAAKRGLLTYHGDYRILASKAARELFSQYTVTVGSTGNLGLSIGTLAAALGFETVVHMSTDAKKWKKERLRNRGVTVIEHEGDYADAIAAGRSQALADSRCHFVDDERSETLFSGYAAGARYLATQLADAGRIVDESHPLLLYLPCGVGGAPGGLTFGLKAIYGRNVHCFFAEPVASPCMLVQLAAGCDEPMSVYDIGLDNHTEADGLAVGLASRLVSPLMVSLLSGIYTVTDDRLYDHLLLVKQTMGIELEPSAAAGVSGPGWLADSDRGREYIFSHKLDMAQATHVIWATGGSLMPTEEHRRFQCDAADSLSNKRASR